MFLLLRGKILAQIHTLSIISEVIFRPKRHSLRLDIRQHASIKKIRPSHVEWHVRNRQICVITNQKFAYIQIHFIHFLQSSKEIRTLELWPACLSLPLVIFFFVFLCNNCQSLAWTLYKSGKKVLIAAFDFNPIFAVNN